MKLRALFLAIAIFFVVVYFQTAPGRAETSPSAALSGMVSSVEEGPMEGVLVGAKKVGSTITTRWSAMSTASIGSPRRS